MANKADSILTAVVARLVNQAAAKLVQRGLIDVLNAPVRPAIGIIVDSLWRASVDNWTVRLGVLVAVAEQTGVHDAATLQIIADIEAALTGDAVTAAIGGEVERWHWEPVYKRQAAPVLTGAAGWCEIEFEGPLKTA
jgi:hypothetical protein